MIDMMGDVIAGLALLLSAYAVWTTARFNKRQLDLTASQEKLNELLLQQGKSADEESRRADLGASFVRMGPSKYRLKVFNRGRAVARNVRIEFVEGGDTFLPNDVKSKFPLEVLEPQQGVELLAAVHMQTRAKHTIKLIWDDDTSAENEKTVYPTL